MLQIDTNWNRFSYTAIEVRVRMHNYIPLFYVGVITYLHQNLALSKRAHKCFSFQ